jgi:rubrerythrin
MDKYLPHSKLADMFKTKEAQAEWEQECKDVAEYYRQYPPVQMVGLASSEGPASSKDIERIRMAAEVRAMTMKNMAFNLERIACNNYTDVCDKLVFLDSANMLRQLAEGK